MPLAYPGAWRVPDLISQMNKANQAPPPPGKTTCKSQSYLAANSSWLSTPPPPRLSLAGDLPLHWTLSGCVPSGPTQGMAHRSYSGIFAVRLGADGAEVLMFSHPYGRRAEIREEDGGGWSLWSLPLFYGGSTFPPETRVPFTDPGAGSGSNIHCTAVSGRARARA